MPSSFQVHRTILRHLATTPHVEVRLVARFSDPMIGQPNAKTARVFIPDMHLVTEAASARYSYSFNHRHTFLLMLRRLVDARGELEEMGHELRCTQLGDLLDLWREGATDGARIIQENATPLAWLYTHSAGLRSTVLAGNHDADMLKTPSFRRYEALEGHRDAFGVAMHGDWFDPIERLLPDWLQAFFVYIAGALPGGGTYDVGQMRRLLRDFEPDRETLKDRIRLDGAAELGPIRKVDPEAGSMSRIHNVSRAGQDGAHPFIERVVEVVHAAARRDDLPFRWSGVRLVVIGHTHHARITVDDTTDPEHPVVLMDCGAWIERCRDASGSVQKNAQIGVVCGNDCRIYQLVVEG